VALAVLIAQRAGLQHAFWVVLGTLSVLRSNALGTGSTILSALAGTAVGILLGAALITGIGTSQPVLWALLPVAVLRDRLRDQPRRRHPVLAKRRRCAAAREPGRRLCPQRRLRRRHGPPARRRR
jgi:hypothetical protein